MFKVYMRLFLLCILFFYTAAQAQVWEKNANKTTAPVNYALKTYTIQDGLPSKNTTAALKDNRGFMWIGTENGLCKFDGYTFKTYVAAAGDSTSITNNYISAIAQDKNGRLWIGTMDGLNVMDPGTEKFTRYYHRENDPQSISHNKIWALLVDTQGTLWVGTDDGFNQYIEHSNSFKVFQPNSKSPYAMKGKSVNAIIEDKHNNLWLGNWSSGLNCFNKKTQRFSNYKQPEIFGAKSPNDVWSLSADEHGNIWVGTYWNGLFKFNPNSKIFTPVKPPLHGSNSVYSIMLAETNTLLVGGFNGFYWLNTANNSWKELKNVANHADCSAYTDKSGIIWICARGGLTKIDPQQYKFNLFRYELGDRLVKDILVAGSALWLGTSDGLYKYDYSKGVYKVYKPAKGPGGPASNQISKLYRDLKGTIWVLTENGFDEYNEGSDSFIHHAHHSALGSLFNEDVFRDILEVAPDEYWLATDAGLKIYNKRTNTFKHYYNQKGNKYSLNNNHLYALLKDKDGDIWIGTYGGGLNRFDRKSGRFYAYMANGKTKGSISSNIVISLYQDADDNIWVATRDGLNLYDKKTDTFKVYSKQNGFASNVFTTLTQDTAGHIWVLTENGLSTLDPHTQVVKNFDEADGIYVNTAMYKDAKSGIYLAGNQGLVYFNPLSIRYNRSRPPIYFTELQIFNKPVIAGPSSPLQQPLNVAKMIKLKHYQNVFSVEFVALNFTHSEKNEYAYLLQGFDKKWNYVGSQRKATYTNLNPGTYTLIVRASNNDGVWNKQGRHLTIIVLPPWYQTWWAYLLYTFAACLVVYTYIKYRDRQAKLKYEVKLAHIESEKEKELNEKKLSFFTNISHEFRTPLTLIINPVKELLYRDDKNVDTTNLNIVYRNARRLLSLVDQLLLFRKADSRADNLKISRLNIVNLCKEVYLCFSYQARSKNIKFEFNSSADEIALYADREKLEIALFNLLSNAFKFTPVNGIISLTITAAPNDVNIAISDSGCGIPESTGDKLYNRFYQESSSNNSLVGGFGIGLFLVKNFIEAHGGNISYQSKEGLGTTFNIRLLKGRHHLQPGFIFDDAETSSVFLKELIEDEISANAIVEAANEPAVAEQLAAETKTLLIIDDNKDIREYLKQVFKLEYTVFEADNGEDGLKMIKEFLPDIVISDVMMQGMSGIELCSLVKEDINISHIPVILLTASSSPEIKLKGIEGGADDYISKPFDKEILIARVAGILKSKNNLQKYFYNEITLNVNNLKISAEYKQFLDNCIKVVEKHITDPDFNIQILASEIGMSRSNLFKKIKSISGQSSNSFIRFIRLRKAAELFINTDNTISETSYLVGINDPKYFREQFNKLFNMNPSQYIKKYRKTFSNKISVSQDMVKYK